MKEILLILPNQLFKNHDKNIKNINIWYHSKFFTKLNYHKNKLHFHYASLMAYEEYMKKKYTVQTIINLNNIKVSDIEKIHIYDPTDFEIEKEIKTFCKKHKIELNIIATPLFILNRSELDEYLDMCKNKKKNPYFNHTFYIWIRNKTSILMKNNKPEGGKYSYDVDNRLPFKTDYTESKLKLYSNKYIKNAKKIVDNKFSTNPGEITPFIPVTYTDAKKHFDIFLEKKLKNFGPYEDGFREDVLIGYHACISALINVGLLEVNYVIDTTLEYYKKHNIPLQSVEAFLRQIISWREYVRMLYLCEHNKFNKMNFFKHTRKINKNWYDGTTGMKPVDDVINKVNKLSYAHHIERLMIISNFALLTKISPKEIYNWFLSFVSIDAYEWVMEPNVYGMGIHSVGTLMMNRPYFSSSNYLFKMGKISKTTDKIILGKEEYDWYDVWDSLYYSFIHRNKDYLKKIYSTASSVAHLNNKPLAEVKRMLNIAKLYMKKY
jgi:deoxyribodipyrimidine photolyase-related protein